MKTPYTFTGTAMVDAPPAIVRQTVLDLARYPEWWPQVVAVASLGPDDARVLCRSRLPYTLDLVLHAVEREGEVLEVEVGGDLEGWVRWSLTGVEGGTRLDFEQQVTVSGLLGLASAVARPLLRWNHQRMMAGCVAGLRARLSE